jgi:hypothetical protein
MESDHGRADVYAAENAAFEGTTFEQVTTLDELARLAQRLCAADWWPLGPIAVMASRSDALSSSTRQHGNAAPVVRLAGPQMTPATLIHELGHVLAGVEAGHGPLFRRAYADLAAAAFGAEEASWLVDQFRVHGLDVGVRSWPAPEVRGGPIAL